MLANQHEKGCFNFIKFVVCYFNVGKHFLYYLVIFTKISSVIWLIITDSLLQYSLTIVYIIIAPTVFASKITNAFTVIFVVMPTSNYDFITTTINYLLKFIILKICFTRRALFVY